MAAGWSDRRRSLLVRETDGELILLDTESNQVHQLNPTASTVWRLHHEGWAPQAIADALAERYVVSAEQAQADVSTVLTRMRALKLLADDETV